VRRYEIRRRREDMKVGTTRDPVSESIASDRRAAS